MVTFININMANEAVNKGLVVLAGMGKSIKEGNTSAVPSIFRGAVISAGNSQLLGGAVSIEQGGNAVLQEVGINPNLLSQFGISPGQIVNTGFNMAKTVFAEVVNGDFSLSSITDAVKKPFEDLSDFLGNVPTGGASSAENKNPSPWAVDKSSKYNHPKFKFLFIVEFIFQDDFQAALGENGNNMAFVVRTASRPNVNVEYEDINLYNFRTKIPKFTEYQPISMSFFDDQSNQTTSFYKKYLELLIPNMSIPEASVDLYESSSLNFTDDKDTSPFSSSSLQALPGKSGHKNIIKSVRLFHIWGWGQFVNVYKFHNPKISEINVSDLDMETNDLCEIQIQFSYDGLNIETNTAAGNNISLDPGNPDAGGYNIPDYSSPGGRADYPLRYNGDSNAKDKMNGPTNELEPKLKKKSLDVIEDYTNPDAPDSDFLGTTGVEEGGFFSDIGDFLSNAAGSASNLVSDTLSSAKSVLAGAIPNVNPLASSFASALGSAALGGDLSIEGLLSNSIEANEAKKAELIYMRDFVSANIERKKNQPNMLG